MKIGNFLFIGFVSECIGLIIPIGGTLPHSLHIKDRPEHQLKSVQNEKRSVYVVLHHKNLQRRNRSRASGSGAARPRPGTFETGGDSQQLQQAQQQGSSWDSQRTYVETSPLSDTEGTYVASEPGGSPRAHGGPWLNGAFVSSPSRYGSRSPSEQSDISPGSPHARVQVSHITHPSSLNNGQNRLRSPRLSSPAVKVPERVDASMRSQLKVQRNQDRLAKIESFRKAADEGVQARRDHEAIMRRDRSLHLDRSKFQADLASKGYVRSEMALKDADTTQFAEYPEGSVLVGDALREFGKLGLASKDYSKANYIPVRWIKQDQHPASKRYVYLFLVETSGSLITVQHTPDAPVDLLGTMIAESYGSVTDNYQKTTGIKANIPEAIVFRKFRSASADLERAMEYIADISITELNKHSSIPKGQKLFVFDERKASHVERRRALYSTDQMKAATSFLESMPRRPNFDVATIGLDVQNRRDSLRGGSHPQSSLWVGLNPLGYHL